MFMLFLEIVTIGLPFCGLKIIGGLVLNQKWLVLLGIFDLFFNVINLFSLLFIRATLLDTCFFSFLVNRIKRPHVERKTKWIDFGNSIDVLFSFLLVAFIIGGGFIPTFPPHYLFIWNLSVIFNVIGAGSSRIYTSVQNLKMK